MPDPILPTPRAIAHAIDYAEREFGLDDDQFSHEQIAEGLAIGPGYFEPDDQEFERASAVILQIGASDMARIVARALVLRAGYVS